MTDQPIPTTPQLDLRAEETAAGPIDVRAVLDNSTKRPDITPAQIVSGIPIIAEAAHAFGVFDLSQAQQDSLSKLVIWSLALLGADAVIRLGRNLARRL